MGTYKDLLVWQKSMELVKAVYQLTADFPMEERFGLSSQMRRCSLSIPSNISEGFGRCSDKDLLHFLYISLGSSNELDTQIILAFELSFINESQYKAVKDLNTEVNKMLASLIYRRKNGMDTNLKPENNQKG